MKRKDKLLLGATGVLSASAFLWFLYKKNNKKLSEFDKMQKLLGQQIYDGFNKQQFQKAFSELTRDVNYSIKDLFNDSKFQGQVCCSSYISGTSVGFYCFDCEVSPLISSSQMAQCADCFNKANHEGHRYSQIEGQASQVACKCGDKDFLKSQGFCKDHKGLNEDIEQEIREILKNNSEEVTKFNKQWKGVFLQMFFLIENAQKMNLGKEMTVNVISVIDQLLHEVDELLKSNIGYSILFADFLTSQIYSQADLDIIRKHLMQQYSTIPSPTNNNDNLNQSLFKNEKSGNNDEENLLINRMLYHNCRNIQEISFVSTAQRMSIPCKCSYIENLIRFSSYLVPNLIKLTQDIILKIQCVPTLRRTASSIIPKMLHFIDQSSKMLIQNYPDSNFFSPFLMMQRFTYPVEYGCLMILDMNSFSNIFTILSKMIEGMALQTRLEQLKEVMQILDTLKSITSQSEVNFLIFLTDSTFLKNLLKTLSKIEKRGIQSSFGQQNFYVQISQISACQSILQSIVYQIVRDMTLLADEVQSQVILDKLLNSISCSNSPTAAKLVRTNRSDLIIKNEEMLQLFFSAWLINYESVQFDKKSISNMVNSKQDFLTFSTLVSILIYSVSYRDFKGEIENISYNSIVNTLEKYLKNNLSEINTNFPLSYQNHSKSEQNQMDQQNQNNQQNQKDPFLPCLQQLFIDLDSNIHKNPYSIFSKEQQLEQLNQILNLYNYNQNRSQFGESLTTYYNQWNNYNNEVILLLRQIGLLIAGDKLYDQFYEPFPKVGEMIEEKGQPKIINALQIGPINSQLNRFSDNACLSFLYSYHFQFLKANFMAVKTQEPLSIETMDINLRSSVVQTLIQFFFFLNNQVTMAQFKTIFEEVIFFKKFGLKSEQLLLKFANFDQKKKEFSLKKEFMEYGSNLTLWNQISFYQKQFNLYEKSCTSEVTGTVQDILFVQEDFTFDKVVTIENITYKFNKMHQINILNFTRFITQDKFINSLQSLLIGIQNIPKNISFLTLLQYIIYFIKESKHSPNFFANIALDYKPSLFHILYEKYIKSNLLQTFFINILQVKDTQNIQTGSKTLLKMIGKIIEEEEGIIQVQITEDQQPLTADDIEKQKEEQRKKKIEDAKRKQQEMLQKFAQQRNNFQIKQEDTNINEDKELSLNITLQKQLSILKNSDNEIEYCSICSEQIEKNSEFGYPIYIKQTNTLAYLQSLENQPPLKQSIDDDFYISINSCGHFYHYDCWQVYQNKNSKRNERNAHLYRNESEIPCSLCKRLANNFIQYIPESMRSRYSRISFNKAKNLQESIVVFKSEYLQDAFKNTLDFSQNEKLGLKDNQFFSFFENAELHNEEEFKDQQEKKEEEMNETLTNSAGQLNSLSLNKSLSKSIMFSKNDFITNVQDYLVCLSLQNQEGDLLRIKNLQEDSFEKIFLKPFHHIQFSEIQEFISTHYKVLSNLLEYMRMNYLSQIRNSHKDKSNIQFKAFSEIHKEKNLSDLFLREILSYFCLSVSLDPLFDMNIFFQYFILILADSIKDQIKSNIFDSTFLVQVINDEFQLQNHMNNLKSLLQYFLSYLCFRNVINVKDLSKFDFCLVSSYFEVFTIAYKSYLLTTLEDNSPSFRLTLSKFAEKNQNSLDLDYEIYSKKLKPFNSQNKCKNIFALNLPFNFEQFKRAVDKKKCQKCDSHPFCKEGYLYHLGVSVCLLCDYSVCKSMCKQDLEKNVQQKMGNLCQHAVDFHGGSSIYIDALVTNVSYVHYPKNIVFESIYSTKYGEQVGLSTLNWNDYNLDQNINEIIRKAVIYNSIPETLFKFINGYEKNFVQFEDKSL